MSIYIKNDQECKRTAKANCNELVKIREKELVLKCKQNYRFNWEKSVKVQEKDIDWKPMQNYRANLEPVKTQKKEELNS